MTRSGSPPVTLRADWFGEFGEAGVFDEQVIALWATAKAGRRAASLPMSGRVARPQRTVKFASSPPPSLYSSPPGLRQAPVRAAQFPFRAGSA